MSSRGVWESRKRKKREMMGWKVDELVELRVGEVMKIEKIRMGRGSDKKVVV